ncbi:MFS transporter [Rubellimicrobium sp. CFH 75288]|uniref:MFS transporter n=1 Tax=Rubellimicrobium sp. CFH 75288 TaxID=2697034 RepID=UPI001411CF2B|nr:MFS transporter [Rubellimicrobium sp. CFH 75288]NAZ36656.1 MFS transporter [Rubellimicrobium sp. CFH 75288]
MNPLPFLLATLFLDAMGIGIVYPVMPDLIAELRGVDIGGAAIWGGVLATAYAAMQFLCAPVLGALSDRFGRRPVLLLSLAVMAADYVAAALATSIWVLLALRLLAGITAATHATCNAVAADWAPPERRAQTFGYLGAAFMGGFILGPVIGGLLGEWGPRAPFWAAAALAAANFAFGWWALPETVTPERRRRLTADRVNPFGAMRAVGRLRGVGMLLLVLFLVELAFLSYVVVWPYWGKAAFGWTPLQTGISLAAFGVAAIGVQAYGVRLYLRLFGERGALLVSLAYTAAFFVVFAVLPPTPWGGWLAILLCPVSALGEVMLPILQGRVSRLAPEDAQGEALGVVASARSAAQMIGPLVMAGVFAWGAAIPGGRLLGAPFLLGAVLMGASLWLVWRSTAPRPLPAT